MARHSVVIALLLLSAAHTSFAATLEEARRAIRLRDYPTAVSLLEALVDQEDAEAQYQLGGLYRAGQGVPRDREEALRLITAAAGQGHARAREVLARPWAGGATGDERPAERLRQAAQSGDEPALRLLVAQDVDVNGADAVGRTALMEAAFAG